MSIPRYIECLIFAVNYGESNPGPLQPQASAQGGRISGFVLLPTIEAEAEEHLLNLFSPHRVRLIRGRLDCPDSFTLAIREGRVTILYIILCPSIFAIYNDRPDTLEFSRLFSEQCIFRGIRNLKNSDEPITSENIRTVFEDERCLVTMLHLIAFKADISYEGDAGTTFLHLAIYKRCELLIRCLLQSGASTEIRTHKDETALHMAIRFSAYESILKLLIERTTDINATMTALSYAGVTPLHLALRHSISLQSIKCLLENGADVNACDKEGCSILKEAVTTNPDVLSCILEYNPKSRDSNGKGILRQVLKPRIYRGPRQCNGETDINASIDKLLTCGFNLDPEDAEDAGVLSDAIRAGSLELVVRLLKWGASLTDESDYRMPALHTAAAHAGESMIRVLLGYGADVNVKNSMGRTPLTVAAMYGNLESLKFLLTRGAVLQEHPLILHAVLSGSSGRSKKIETIKFLIEAGANVNAPPNCGQSPIALAYSLGLEEGAEMLIQNGARLNTDTFLHFIKREDLANVVHHLRSGVDVIPHMKEAFFEAFSSKSKLMLAFLIMLEYPCASSIEGAMGNSLWNFPCSGDGLKYVLQYEYLSLDRIFSRDPIFPLRDIPHDDDFKYYNNMQERDYDVDEYDEYVDGIIGETYNRDEAMQYHFSALVAADLTINKGVSNEKLSELDRELLVDRFIDGCAGQVRAMKSKIVGGSKISFYDILDATIPQIGNFLQNDSIVDALNDMANYEEFPSYRGMISKRFHKALFRKLLLVQGVKMFNFILALNRHLHQLPSGIKLKIVDFLSNHQLFVLSNVCKLPSDDLFLANLMNLVNISAVS